MNRLLLLILGLFICTLSFGQKNKTISWKAYKKKAEDLIQLRQYAKAAAAYEKAYTLKTQRGDLLVKAADNYMLERDFRNASRVYAQVVDNPKYKSSKLNYAYSLKQSNQFEQAMLMFASCLDNVAGKNKQEEAKINKEIMGCQFALEQAEGFVVKPYGIDIKPISSNINSLKSEFSPYHVSDTKLYYSTLIDGNAKIKASEWRDGDWSIGMAVKGFNGLKNKHLCNAVVNSDETEMFFTICNEDQVWGGLSSRCDIYVSNKKGKAWGQPKKLNENVNHSGSTNTQPFVLVKDGVQQIYFASNRPNGQGGMDLWFASRALGEKEFDEAVNLGPNVNTIGNEITPFFNETESSLYFSSDGHLTMGGFDIFKSVGSKFSWSPAENLGMPINTGADEKYYTVASNHTEGYFVSNRSYGEEKPTSTDEDIFTFNILPPHYFVQGVITDERDLSFVENGEVYLYELKAKTQDRRLLSVQNVDAGKYNFRLLPNRNYQLSADAEGYGPTISYVNTSDENLYVQVVNLSLNTGDIQSPVASINEVLPSEPVTDTPVSAEPIKKEIVDEKVIEVIKEAPIEIITEDVVIGTGEEPVIEEAADEKVIEVTEETTVEVENTVEDVVVGATEEPIIEEAVEEKIVFGATEGMHETMPNEEVVPLTNEEIVAEVKEDLAIEVAAEVSEADNTTFVESVAEVTEKIARAETPQIKNTTETYITNTVIAESSSTSNSYANTESNTSYTSNNSFVSKGTATVPSGTGIYKYDSYNDAYKKEGTLLADKPISYSEPSATYSEPTVTYSEPTITYGGSVPAIEVPLDKYEVKRNSKSSSSSKTAKSKNSSSSILMGTTYQVQLIAVEYHNPENRRYDGIRNLGLNLNTEYIEGKGWTRVLLGSFKSEAEASSILANARSNGFKRAFVVKYVDGQRRKKL